MRQAAKVVGVVWIVACAALWFWIAFFMDFDPLAAWPTLSNWSVVTLIADTKAGLTFVPFLLGAVGAAICQWGYREPSGRP